MDAKESKLPYVLAFLMVGAVAFGIYWMFFKPAPQEEKKDDGGGVAILDESQTDTPLTPETPAVVEKPDTVEEETPVEPTDTDFSTFSNSSQSVGNSGNSSQYTLKSVEDSKEDGFHSFVFNVQAKTSETMESPYVVVKYMTSQGSIRVDLNGVTKDESGIGYQKSRNIDEQGVIRLYHNISSDPKEELYDIGVAKQTLFKIVSVEDAENTWKITLSVKYPGGNTTSETFGSDAFSKDVQAIDGGLKVDNSKVVSYSYSTAGGVLSLVFNVSGSTSRPVPSATAEYNSEGKLVLSFTSLVSDNVHNSLDGDDLGGFGITTEKVGDKYVYTFNGPTKEFKLYGSKSPNQVILEIKL
ncbi:hypothetical protein IT417_02425 [bacterium]|nr:hypothetical protein [bacterium]